MVINSRGINIVDSFPIPLSISLTDTTQKTAHNINVQTSVGNIILIGNVKFEFPPT